ncbi:MAG TPA: ABC transporter permease, partial [Pirellulaceae bacterium]|nr:ABC transporter permease [Pirellulaceae bacterium]
ERNQAVRLSIEQGGSSGGPSNQGELPSSLRGELFLFEDAGLQVVADEDRLRFSQQVRDEVIYAFVEIPEQVLDFPMPDDIKVRFYSQDSSFAEARNWLTFMINDFVRSKRLRTMKIDPLDVQRASVPVQVAGMGLVERATSGEILAPREKDRMSDIVLPLIAMMLMFMVIFMAAQPMLESVLEEKSQRIAEVLLGSASPFQLMIGKLLGTVGGSLTVFLIYLAGGIFVLQRRGMLDHFPIELAPWFVAYQIVGVLFFAAIFMAVGASVSQLKEAQSLLLPVWMLMMLPMFMWILILQDPKGTLAVVFSYFPPSAGTTMVLRLATGVSIPIWERLLTLLVMVLATLAVIAVAARIFRVGILWQGKTPRITEIIRWGFRG